ncbi:MAG: AzlC family ABC transporter permease [Bowdeniella nasicola]|nr:AzlC family ABC transporter permease [Bowdeniella nasicola]
MKNAGGSFSAGLRAGIPIGLGYFAVSLAIGLYWAHGAYPPLAAAIFSATNMSSTGQFAAITIALAKGGIFELAATTLLVNLRYLLMSISLSQRLDPQLSTGKRLALAAGVTDEIYALNISRPTVQIRYYLASMILPIAGWTCGTVTGALAGQVIPPSLQSAAGILLFAMFIAIVVPPALSSHPVRVVIAVAGACALVLAFTPVIRELDVGWRIIVATCIASALGATCYPISSQTAALGGEGDEQRDTGRQDA